MIDHKRLKTYEKRYNEIRNEYINLTLVKEDLERQLKHTEDNKTDCVIELDNICNGYGEECVETWNEHQVAKRNYYKNVFLSSVGCALLMALGFFISPSLDFSIAFAIVCVIDTYFFTRKLRKDVPPFKLPSPEFESREITRLGEEMKEEEERELEIKKTIKMVNERLKKLGEVKIDVENLILCLFSSLDNILRNKSTYEETYASWLEIDSTKDHETLEVVPVRRRERKEMMQNGK